MDRTGKTALWLVGGHAGVLALCFAGTYTQSDQVPDGRCEGIGGGCTMTARDTTQFLLGVFGLPALIISLLVCLVTLSIFAGRRERRTRRFATHRGPGSEAQRAGPGGSDGRAPDEPEQ